jgi:hypothetical protein
VCIPSAATPAFTSDGALPFATVTSTTGFVVARWLLVAFTS